MCVWEIVFILMKDTNKEKPSHLLDDPGLQSAGLVGFSWELELPGSLRIRLPFQIKEKLKGLEKLNTYILRATLGPILVLPEA